MLSKQYLKDYIDALKEIDEIQEKINRLESEIAKVEERILQIQEGETVKDLVYGGDGGQQPFHIEGVPTPEYEERKQMLKIKKALLSQRKATLEILKIDLVQKTHDVEMFIASIDDSQMRRIVNLRFIQRLSWTAVAMKVGGGNTDETVRQAFHRFMNK